jgi:predicted nucleic acid-binding protein
VSNIPNRFVLDASVGIKLFVEEEFSEHAVKLINQISDDSQTEIHVPDLFYIECANILLKYTRRFHRPFEDSLADIRDLGDIALKNTPTSQLALDAFQLASEKNLTSYDACYAVLARKLEIPLITADARLSKAIDWAIWIGDIEI